MADYVYPPEAYIVWAPDDEDHRAFRQAVIDGDVERVEAALKPNIDINAYHSTESELHRWVREKDSLSFGEDDSPSSGKEDEWPEEGRPVLHEAAAKGHVEVIWYLLAQGARINSCDWRNKDYDWHSNKTNGTALHAAASCAQVEAVRVLLDAGADGDIRAYEDVTALHAVLLERVETLRRLLHAGADRDIRANEDVTALHAVHSDKVKVIQSHIDTIVLLLDRGLDINARTSTPCFDGDTVLEQAVGLRHHGLIKNLLEKGARPANALDTAAKTDTNTVKLLLAHGLRDDSGSALCSAAFHGKTDIVRALLADANAVRGLERSTAPLSAAYNGNVGTLNYLLDQGFDVTARDHNGQTPLHAACSNDRPSFDVIRTLLDRGADVAAKDVRGWIGMRRDGGTTPLHAAVRNGNAGVLRLLLHAGADVNARNDAGETPLILLGSLWNGRLSDVRYPHIDAYAILLEAGADVHAEDLQRRTSLHALAACPAYDPRGNRLQPAEMLLNKGANAWARDVEGKTPADLLQPCDLGSEFGHLLRILANPLPMIGSSKL